MTGLRALAGSVAILALTVQGDGVFNANAQTAPILTIQRIEIEGERRIDPSTIVTYSGLSRGQAVSPRDLNDALGRIFETGLFEDVVVTPTADGVLITVVENPTVNRIAFEGNELVPDEALERAVRLQPRRAFNRSTVESDAQAIVEAYRGAGRFNATVNPVIIRQPDNRVDVVFEIVEGEVTEVERILFIGNRVFSDGELRDVIDTRQAGFLSGLFSSDNYSADRLNVDQEQLRQFYLNRGYADFDVTSTLAELNDARDGFIVTFTVSEGPLYRFGDVSIRSNTPGLGPDRFEGTLRSISGEAFDQRTIEDTIEEMTARAGDLGYAFTEVVPRVTRNTEDRTIDLVFEVQDGDRIFVERIDIVGNTATLDRVIRREFNVVEGDVFDARSIARTEDRLRALGFFSNVEVSARRGSQPDRAVVRAEVEDQLTGSVDFGVEYSSSTGLGGTIGLVENNFLGRGQRVAIDVSVGDQEQAASFSFTEPRFLDRDLALGLDVFSTRENRDTASFQESSTGFQPRVGFPISDVGSLSLRYRLSEDEIFGATDTNTVSKLIRDEQGTRTTSSFGATYVHDQRNSAFAPTDGYILTLSGDVAGLGGDTEYLQAIAKAKWHTAFRDEEVTAHLELEVGSIFSDGGTRVTDRFFLGGSSFRGFSFGGFGPRDRDTSGATSVDSALGGKNYLVARAQTAFPIGNSADAGLHFGVFANAGALWGLDATSAPAEAGVRGAFSVDDSPVPRVSAGVTVFWDSAIGPLRIDFAEAIVKEPGDDTEFFRLGAGRRF
ncbi:outer membrane protein insertion porin family [Rubricella aquisinus]|uniref:Outer membrane protein assembly factor BamA n=1 Tax=Rubricella aquisinus TaxID=2028108 RepID=A0A840WHW2_9RHOB|nr:outer membrane protein assembly factor BamA [Rubricella aquisinus]MBB5514718.1 outer membrane protein insertion porin family [Rubricella aquisinus]